ncbi:MULTISPECIES: DUF421 domain-containing protein [Paenibacillus]|uniref:DUF421 domain-containing protein n=2 Tax=Paenibacillus TaxID=44249 RepID=A0ABU6DAM4_9BACL|nr:MULTISPECIES: DUF421 domain-containing protein [Paenibacillus]MBA2939268.1 DUF421 domain-containing protein [Paenibacillus sp. CGMCC 1.16610]MCY9661077.1 DUF421 domain-containing protein [Paenibacillus anseongense]MEB4794802.1 DUF421 domain-containing protein [Paenibacillus chondroitinus]MVQ35227.1 DUF421 domain-containing protein [Paenibacillus anseongense]
MDILTIFLRTVLIYFVVFLMLRLMGKREIGKLSLFDLVISIMIAEIAVFVLEDVKKPIMDGIVPMATLVLIQIIIAYVTLKNRNLRILFDGKPSVIIKQGLIDREEMRKHRYNLDDLMQQLRQNKIMNVADVEFAVLEPSGKLSVVEKSLKAKETAIDEQGLKGTIRYEGLPLPLIMDGKVQDDNLEKIGKTRFWLKNQLQFKGARDFKEVFYCSIDHRGRMFLDRKR